MAKCKAFTGLAVKGLTCKYYCAKIPEWILELQLYSLFCLICTLHSVCCARIVRRRSRKSEYNNKLQTQKHIEIASLILML